MVFWTSGSIYLKLKLLYAYKMLIKYLYMTHVEETGPMLKIVFLRY